MGHHFVTPEFIEIDYIMDIHTKFVDAPISSHQHDCLELAYIKKGCTLHTINGKTTPLNQGDYIIVDYSITHSYDSVSSDLEVINFLFKPSLIDSSLKSCKSVRSLLSNYMINIGYGLNYSYAHFDEVFHDTTGEILHILHKISNEYTSKKLGHIQIIRSAVVEMIIQTARQLQYRQDFLLTKEDPIIQNMIKEINTRFLEELSLSQLAKTFNMSASHLSRKFQSITGYKFSQYIQIKKIEYACILLINTDYKISEIAFQSGYNDIKHFNEVFKNSTKLTPMQYRKTMRA